MHVHVLHVLAADAPGVDDRPEPVGRPLLARESAGEREDLAENGRVGGRGVGQHRDVLLRHEHEVHRGDGLDVVERQHVVVLVIVALIFGTKKLRNIGGDLGGAVKGFKDGMKEANSDKPAEPVTQQRVAGDTIDVQAKEKSNS